MISIIIPIFNGEKYLDECLSSIDCKNNEVIIVNDESIDNGPKIAEKYTDKIINIKHSGPVIARNIGLKNTSGEYVMFMDCDDVLMPNAVNEMLKNIDGFDGVIGRRRDFISPDCINNINTAIKTSNHGVIAGCALFKKSGFDIVGDFDSDLLCGDGYEWLIRAEKNGLIFNKINNIFCMRRIHNNNMGRTMQKKEKDDYIKIIKKHFMGK